MYVKGQYPIHGESEYSRQGGREGGHGSYQLDNINYCFWLYYQMTDTVVHCITSQWPVTVTLCSLHSDVPYITSLLKSKPEIPCSFDLMHWNEHFLSLTMNCSTVQSCKNNEKQRQISFLQCCVMCPYCEKHAHNFFSEDKVERSVARRHRMSLNVWVKLMDCFPLPWPWPLLLPHSSHIQSKCSLSSLSSFHWISSFLPSQS